MLTFFFSVLTLTTVAEAQNNFTPGCSFYNGQCVYNVKLGHEQQCDVSTRTLNNEATSTGAPTTGFQACSCKDVDNLNRNVDSLWKSLNQLQTDISTLAQALNVSKDQLSHKDGQIGDLLSHNSNLTAQLANTNMLLNKSQVDLVNTVQQMGAELARLRTELSQSNKDLSVCKTTLNVLDTSPKPDIERYEIVKRRLGFRYWWLDQEDSTVELILDGQPVDTFVEESLPFQVNFGPVAGQEPAEITRLTNESSEDISAETTGDVSNQEFEIGDKVWALYKGYKYPATVINKSETILYGDIETYQFDFENSSNGNFTLSSCSSSQALCWERGSGRQNTMSGPTEDHTFGAPQGHYMFIDPYRDPPYSSYSSSGYNHGSRTASMTSPEFPPAREYCVRFWYTLYGSDIGHFKVYAKRFWVFDRTASSRQPTFGAAFRKYHHHSINVGGGNGYPVLTKTGQEDKYWHMAQISLSSEYTSSPFKLVFEASSNSYYHNDYSGSHINKNVYNGYGYTAFDDVYVYNTSCSSIPDCPSGAHKMVDGNRTSCYTFHIQPATWYDAVKTCKSETISSHLVSINSRKEQQVLVDTIQNDAGLSTAGGYGWFTSGNDERNEARFVWTDTGYPYPLNYTNWHAGQPNNVGNVQNCLLMEYAHDDFEWGDVNCNDKHPFICETHI